jgi:hypothetical protein
MLTPFVPTYVNGVKPILDWYSTTKDLPPWAFLFTSDADAMYNNIDTSHAIEVIGKWMEKISSTPGFPTNYPLRAIKSAMATIMRNNHFEFGDLNILQLLGTAMGTSSACMWATIYYGVHESETLIPKFKPQLKDGKMIRWIDDIFGCWVCNQCKSMNCSHWRDFVTSLPFGKLTWTTDKPNKTVVFLDMTVSIEKGRITTSTYQKPMNLYLYLPPTSNHNPRQCKAIIYQLLKKYKIQNTNYQDYLKYSALLYRRHRLRGHQPSQLRKYFSEAHNKIINSAPLGNTTILTSTGDKRQSFLHFQYNSTDLPAKAVMRLHAKHCHGFEQDIGLSPPKMCYSRPKNIGDLATQTKLHQHPTKPASHYMGEFQKGLDP